MIINRSIMYLGVATSICYSMRLSSHTPGRRLNSISRSACLHERTKRPARERCFESAVGGHEVQSDDFQFRIQMEDHPHVHGENCSACIDKAVHYAPLMQ